MTSPPARLTHPLPPEPTRGSQRREELQRRGVFGKIDFRGRRGVVHVGSGFCLLEVGDKEAFVGMVFAYFAAQTEGDSDVLGIDLVDRQSGKKVGSYMPEWGLSLK